VPVRYNLPSGGLGLDARRQAVARHITGSGELAAEFTEIESGRRDTNRPQLHAALAECRKRRAVLLIARLDRNSWRAGRSALAGLRLPILLCFQ
jgi:DNA invertase Pin-like site-specific DNA recombinase